MRLQSPILIGRPLPHLAEMSKDSPRLPTTDPRIRRQRSSSKNTGDTRSHLITGSFKRKLTEQEMMEIEALEMSMNERSEEHVASYFEWQERSNRPAPSAPAPRVGAIKRLFYRLTGRG